MNPKDYLDGDLVEYFKRFIACYVFFAVFVSVSIYLGGGFTRIGESVLYLVVFLLSLFFALAFTKVEEAD